VAVGEARWSRILEGLRASGFRELTGARLTATIPIGERLLNDLVASSLPAGGVVREAAVQPQLHNRVAVRVKLARPEFLPAITATLVIERQPQLPQTPALVFRVSGLPGLLALAGPVLRLAPTLPAGIHLQGDLLTVDLGVLLAERGHGDVLRYAERLQVTTEPGRLVIDADVRVPS
jgi:hypothetical protein